ncbi:hypothetical protein TGME49_258040 [Toxoplasma gondii ME49]|uniref:Uncharacterized protein n=1 Tax=Toxoplasma gondii (strain ATCC 50611 / Me49) TaxID=508771 RepID=S8GLC9_TOXGM|nr:hypothetical protein TGME49_258040 [Toxoplasma gondii ME49]EPT29309.1 hypothetical protein TGME49_258040 [Toxoplasma gondii ME49]|eukprot:XP_002365028.1 hypothetical protein TGME49_258040 [Toxoplasma gondii ME49]
MALAYPCLHGKDIHVCTHVSIYIYIYIYIHKYIYIYVHVFFVVCCFCSSICRVKTCGARETVLKFVRSFLQTSRLCSFSSLVRTFPVLNYCCDVFRGRPPRRFLAVASRRHDASKLRRSPRCSAAFSSTALPRTPCVVSSLPASLSFLFLPISAFSSFSGVRRSALPREQLEGAGRMRDSAAASECSAFDSTLCSKDDSSFVRSACLARRLVRQSRRNGMDRRKPHIPTHRTALPDPLISTEASRI